jgi:hypothetical protein
MTWKLYALVSAGAFVATYLVSSPTKDVAHGSASVARAAAQKPLPESDIEQLAERLHVRVRSEENYRTPGRDLFRFQSRPPRPQVVAPAPAPVAAPALVPAPVLPPVSLSGIASDTADGSPKRSAILSVPAGVLIVREGDSVAGLYKVLSVGEDSVELEAIADGSHRTLRLSRR